MVLENLLQNPLIQDNLDVLLQNPYLQNNYIQALVILLLVYIASKTLIFVIANVVHKITDRTRTKVDDVIIERTKGTWVHVLLFVGVRLAFAPLELGTGITETTVHILNSIIIILLTKIVVTMVDVFLDIWGKSWAKKTKSSIDDQLLPLVHSLSLAVFSLLGLMFLLQEWGIEITGLLAGVGVAGLALSFAIKDSLANIFGGISLVLDKTFKVGDKIKLQSGEMGIIQDIGLRSTKIRTFDNELLIVPNGQLANSRVVNYKLPDLSARIVIEFGVAYGTKIEKVKKVVVGTINKIKNVTKDDESKKPKVLFMNMGDSSLNFKAFFWVGDTGEMFATKEKATCMIYDALNKAKINIPFPTQTVHLKKK